MDRFTLCMMLFAILIGVKGHLHCREPDVIPALEFPITALQNDTMAMLQSYNRGYIKGVPCIFINVQREIMNITTSSGQFIGDSDRSACPWQSYRNVDHNRRPVVLYENRCTTTHCTDCQSEPNSMANYKCKNIFFFVSVLRRVSCVDGIYQYNTVSEPLSAGCTCLGPAPSSPLHVSEGAAPGLKTNT